MNKKANMMVTYGFEVYEEVALFTLECAAGLLSPCWQDGAEFEEWSHEELEWLLMRANALLLEGSL